MNATATQTVETTTIPQAGTTSPALANGIARILQLAAQAAMQGRTDTDLLNALQAIQAATFAAEMEHYGPEEIDQDVPF